MKDPVDRDLVWEQEVPAFIKTRVDAIFGKLREGDQMGANQEMAELKLYLETIRDHAKMEAERTEGKARVSHDAQVKEAEEALIAIEPLFKEVSPHA